MQHAMLITQCRPIIRQTFCSNLPSAQVFCLRSCWSSISTHTSWTYFSLMHLSKHDINYFLSFAYTPFPLRHGLRHRTFTIDKWKISGMEGRTLDVVRTPRSTTYDVNREWSYRSDDRGRTICVTAAPQQTLVNSPPDLNPVDYGIMRYYAGLCLGLSDASSRRDRSEAALDWHIEQSVAEFHWWRWRWMAE